MKKDEEVAPMLGETDAPVVVAGDHDVSEGSVHLDALRGFAAVLVFLNHTRALYFASFLQGSVTAVSTNLPTGVRGNTEVDGELKIASAAVVIFFVLSGYLVGGSVLRSLKLQRWSWHDYATKRLARLMTVLIPAILIGASLDWIGSHFLGAGSIYTAPLGSDLVVAADLARRLRLVVVLGNIAFLQNILVPIAGTNVSLWSLANEFWYYIAFPLGAIAFVSQFSKVLRLSSLSLAIAVLCFIGLKITLLFPIWIMGALISVTPNRLGGAQARMLSVVATFLLGFGVLIMRLVHMHSVPAEYLIGGLTSVLLYGLIAQTGPADTGLYRAIAGFFSRISFSLYLFHLPLAVFLCGLTNTPWHPHLKTARNLALFGLADMLVLGLVYLLWLAFEAKTNAVREFLSKRIRARVRQA